MKVPDTPVRSQTPVVDSTTGKDSTKLIRRGDFEPKAKKQRHCSIDYTVTYLPNGQAKQRSPINKSAMAWNSVIHVKKYSGPVYDTLMDLEDYHLVQDGNTKKFYVVENKVESKILENDLYYKNYKRTGKRKSIDTYNNAHDKRFETIQKDP